MNYVESFNMFGVNAKQIPCITGKGAPTSTTEGDVGCLYMDSATGDIYKCISIEDSVTTWKKIASSDDSKIASGSAWSSKNTVDNLCPSFEESGSVVVCEPLEGYPLEVVSKIPADVGVSKITLYHSNEDDSYEYTVDFHDTYSNGNYNWTTGELTTADEGVIQFSPQAIIALHGENTFRSDCGDTTVSGRADPNEYWGEKLDAITDDTKIGETTWSSKNTVDKLCPTFTESGEWATCNPIETSYLNIETKFRPILPEGFAPSPDNRETIGTWSGGTLYHGGKNLVDLKAVENVKQLTFTDSDGNQPSNYKGFAFSLPAGTYTIHGEYAEASDKYVACVVNTANGDFKETFQIIWANRLNTTTITVNDDDVIYVYNGSSSNSIAVTQNNFKNVVNIMIEPGSTSSPYVPYNSNEVAVDFGQNVYGGTYNWTTGVLLIDVIGEVIDGSADENWGYVTASRGHKYFRRIVSVLDGYVYGLKCDVLPNNNGPFYGDMTGIRTNGKYVELFLADYTTEAEYYAFLEEYKPLVVYGLAAPIEVQLTPQEFVAISGANVCRSNMGETTVKGSESINSVIERLTNAIIALGGNV